MHHSGSRRPLMAPAHSVGSTTGYDAVNRTDRQAAPGLAVTGPPSAGVAYVEVAEYLPTYRQVLRSGDVDEALDILRPLLEAEEVAVDAALSFARICPVLGMKEEGGACCWKRLPMVRSTSASGSPSRICRKFFPEECHSTVEESLYENI